MGMQKLTINNSITVKESPSLDKYLREIRRVPALTAEEEYRLFMQAKEGDKKALDKIIKANLLFVVSVAKQYANQGLPLTDLINEGNIGLIKAARLFDPSRGFKFISYAVWWIRQQIVYAIAEKANPVKLPMNKVALKNQIRKASLQIEQELERPATPEELAEKLHVDLEEVYHGLNLNIKHLSLDATTSEEDETTLMDVLENPNAEKADEELNHTQSLKAELRRSLEILTEQQRSVICSLWGIGLKFPKTPEDVSKEFFISTERVRQIKEKALSKLRLSENIGTLRTFLG